MRGCFSKKDGKPVKILSLLLALTMGCSTGYHVVAKRCPTTTLTLADFFLGTATFGVAAIKWNASKYGQSVAYSTLGTTILLGAHISEARCAK